MKTILLVNPWICDFAAYDMWLKPWGLLKISSILKENGFSVYLADALDRHHPALKDRPKDLPDGTGKFFSEEIEKPAVLKDIPRRYRRYGMPPGTFKKILPDDIVDIVMVSSGMTYWYPGVFEAVRMLKEKYSGVPVVLGGTYATLAHDHALERSGADHVIRNGELGRLSGLLGKKCDLSFRNILDSPIDYSWYRNPSYAVLRLSLGCPFDCAYCAQKKLGPAFMLKDMDKAIGELTGFYERGLDKFAFYDDALLFGGTYITDYLTRIKRSGVKADFYTPNGLHARFLTKDIAKLMKEANFKNPILSLEIADDTKAGKAHRKVTKGDLQNAVRNLKAAGYEEGEYTVYLMLGMPGTDLEDVAEGIDLVHSLGARISLSEFSPIPGTVMASPFKEALSEPLLQNNSVFPAFPIAGWDGVNALKKRARELNSSFLDDQKVPTTS